MSIRDDFRTLKISQRAETLWVEINRPEVHNAISFQVMSELEKLLAALQDTDEFRVFVFSGSGERYFAAGGDLKEFAELITASEAAAMAQRMHVILSLIEKLSIWTVAGINGTAFGGGWEMALAFDFRVAAQSAQIGFIQRKWALTPGWGGMTRLVRQVGSSKALELLAFGSILSMEDAQRLGLVNVIFPATGYRENLWQWAHILGETEPFLIKALKEGARLIDATTYDASLAGEIPIFSQTWAHPVHHDKVKDFFRKSNDA